MSSKPRILFVAPVEPWCRENGSSLVISDLLEGLAGSDQAETLALFLRASPQDCTPRWPDDLDGLTLGARALPHWVSVGTALLRGTSPMRTRFANAHVARRILHVLQAREFWPDLVHMEHLPVFDIGRRVSNALECPLVYRAHNVESRLWERRLDVGGLGRRWFMSRLESFEVEAITSCAITLGISEVDLDWMRTKAPAARVDLLPGTLLFRRYEGFTTDVGVAESQICFVGGLEWPPNEKGLRWFIDHVVPRIAARCPQVTVAVLARGAEDRPWLAKNPHVRLVPPNTKAPHLFAQSRASVAPLLQGGGVRIKILESLAVGCPVVATHIGAEGLELSGVTHTDHPEEFADACAEHLVGLPDLDARRRFTAAARSSHDAQLWGERLIELWLDLVRQGST